MFRQIAKIQKTINAMLGYCSEAGADVTPLADKYESLGVMILKAQDGELPHRAMLEFERWIVNDASAMDYYINFQQLAAQLQKHYNPSRFRADLSCEITV